MRRELIGDLRAGLWARQHVAARDVDLIGKRQRDGVARLGGVDLAVGDQNTCDSALAAGVRGDDAIASRDASGGNRAGEAAKILVRPVDPLHGQSERRAAAILLHFNAFQILEQMRARVPGRAGAQGRDVVSVAGGDRQRGQRAKAKCLGEFPIVGFDLAKHALAVVHEIDLVHRKHNVAHAKQRNDDRMAVRLREQPLAGVDQHDREIGVGRASRHVAGELLVARRIGDDERALFGSEVAIGHVDGDALLAFGLEPVDQQREVDRLASRAELLRVALERRKLVVEDELLLVQHPPDQRGLAVVDRAAGEETQGREGREIGRNIHQKYPSRFFFSIDEASSESIKRPCRSEVVALRISATMSRSVSASDSIAPVSG